MGNSGFYNNGTSSVVYADNINFSGTSTNPSITQDGQLLIGSTEAPNVRVGSITGSSGIVVTNSSGAINLSFDPSQANPELIARNVQLVTTTSITTCSSIFTANNVNNVSSGTQILQITATPSNPTITLVIEANVLVSRREGQIGLSLVQEGKNTPLAFSVGFSAGYPNMCTLKYFLTTGSITPVNLSLRVGGINSGPVVVNGMPNGCPLLSDSLESYLMVTEGILQ